ncbi:MAG: hypothetical protein ACI8SE_001682 [Bacteroidia bacterium]
MQKVKDAEEKEDHLKEDDTDDSEEDEYDD